MPWTKSTFFIHLQSFVHDTPITVEDFLPCKITKGYLAQFDVDAGQQMSQMLLRRRSCKTTSLRNFDPQLQLSTYIAAKEQGNTPL